MTRKIDALLTEYGESHKDPTNKAIHWVCVPVIVWTVAALVYALPVPAFLGSVQNFNWLLPVFLLVLVYYLIASWQLAVGIAVYLAASLWLIRLYEANFAWPLWQFALVVFVVAWIGQFWGHKIEGKKPSFLRDIQFLLIGPAWLLHFLYQRFGIRY